MKETLRQSRKLGWSIVPCNPNKKARGEWKQFQAQAPTTDQLKQWVSTKPSCWAVITGAVSGIVCIDFDGKEGAKTLAQLGLQAHVRTGSGGSHVYVRHPGVRVKTSNGKTDAGLAKLYPGVDIRGDGGYAVFCGRSDKGEYTWLRPMEPDPWDVLPADLRDYITQGESLQATDVTYRPDGRPAPPYDDPRYWLDRYLGKAIVGSRNQMGFHLALELVTQCVKFGVSEAECEAIVCEYADRVPRDPKDTYTRRDAKASFRKALDYGPKEPCGVPTPRAALIDTKSSTLPAKQVSDKELAAYAQTDLGNAERFLARHSHYVRYCSDFGKWFFWDSRRWQEDSTGTIVQLAAATVRAMLDEAKTLPKNGKDSPSLKLTAHARRSESHAKIEAMLGLARSWVGVTAEELDPDPWLLNCKNGVLDLRSGELLDHRADNLITKLVPYDYDPKAQCPNWLNFLDQIFDGNDHLIGYIQRAVGYALTGVIREQCLFFLHGGGANGKSTFLHVVQDIIGDYGRDTPTESLMIKQNEGISNDIARLKGARLVTAVETEADRRMAESLVKRLTGGDTITARFMRQEFFQFRGTFKIFLAANHKPGIRGTDDAIWRRIKLIPFNVQIPEANQDPELPDKLKTEAAGILNWMVAGCRQWQKHGLGEPAEVTDATAVYRDEMDYLGPFLQDCCIEDPTEECPAGDLYRIYRQYCEHNKEKAVSQTRFGLLLSERTGAKKGLSGHQRTRVYQGLTLKSCVLRTGADGFLYYNPCNPSTSTTCTDSTETSTHPLNPYAEHESPESSTSNPSARHYWQDDPEDEEADYL